MKTGEGEHSITGSINLANVPLQQENDSLAVRGRTVCLDCPTLSQIEVDFLNMYFCFIVRQLKNIEFMEVIVFICMFYLTENCCYNKNTKSQVAEVFSFSFLEVRIMTHYT